MWQWLYLYSLYFIMDYLSFQVYWVLHLAKIILICSNKNKNKKKGRLMILQMCEWVKRHLNSISDMLLFAQVIWKGKKRWMWWLGVSKYFFYLYASRYLRWANISLIKTRSYRRHDTFKHFMQLARHKEWYSYAYTIHPIHIQAFSVRDSIFRGGITSLDCFILLLHKETRIAFLNHK